MEGWALIYSGFSHQQPPDLNAKDKWIKLFLKIEVMPLCPQSAVLRYSWCCGPVANFNRVMAQQRGELRCSLTQQAAWPLAIFYLTAADIATATQHETQLVKLTLR